jgi:hypothetical protein
MKPFRVLRSAQSRGSGLTRSSMPATWLEQEPGRPQRRSVRLDRVARQSSLRGRRWRGSAGAPSEHVRDSHRQPRWRDDARRQRRDPEAHRRGQRP